MVRSKSILITALCISLLQVLITDQAEAQTYSYRTYDQTTGLPGDYLSVIAQDQGGFLWVGLESGLFRYDGFEFHPMLMADTLSEAYPNALSCDKEGTIWIGLTDGSIFTWNNGGTPVRKSEIKADKINRITEGPDGRVWIVTQTQGIYTSDPGADNKMTKVTMPEGTVVFDISFSGPDSMLVATQDNLHLCLITGEKATISYTFPELEYTWVQTVRKIDENHWVAGTDGAGLFTVRRENGIMKASAIDNPAFENLRIPDMIAGPGRTLFVATREAGVIRAEFNEDFSSLNPEAAYNMSSGLPENDIKTIFRDREGNLWIGLFNRGLAAVTTNAFSFFKPAAYNEINFIGESNGKVVLPR
jgi:ligand-binding sensor domain-containing protein